MRKLGGSLKLNDNKGYTIAIALMVIVVSSLLIGYYLISRLPPEGYSTIYILDYQQKKAMDYPELLVINQNNTFKVWVGVENHMGNKRSFEVLQKVIKGTIPSFPVDAEITGSYEKTIKNGDTWETPAQVSINETGSCMVIFELWINDDNAGAFQFSNNYCVLNLEVIDQT
jgi:uncharacterized membrane protein